MIEARQEVLSHRSRERRSHDNSIAEIPAPLRIQTHSPVKIINPYTPPTVQPVTYQGPQASQDSMALSRLPVPEPSVFTGDPLKFVEWSLSFRALIERRCPYPADRLFYLQRYIGGEAKMVLEGCFYRKDEKAYQQAWEKLNSRYGNTFVIQRAFREKLNRWPKIEAGEPRRLQAFGDFLQACNNALPHVT